MLDNEESGRVSVDLAALRKTQVEEGSMSLDLVNKLFDALEENSVQALEWYEAFRRAVLSDAQETLREIYARVRAETPETKAVRAMLSESMTEERVTHLRTLFWSMRAAEGMTPGCRTFAAAIYPWVESEACVRLGDDTTKIGQRMFYRQFLVELEGVVFDKPGRQQSVNLETLTGVLPCIVALVHVRKGFH